MTNITLHGEMAEHVGRENWNLKVNSIKEAMRAIQVLSKGKLLKYLIGAAEGSVEYKILVNKREMMMAEDLSLERPESILNSELVMINEKLETLDIVPIIKGAGGGGGGGNSSTKGILAIVLAVILIATGIGAAGGTTLLGMTLKDEGDSKLFAQIMKTFGGYTGKTFNPIENKQQLINICGHYVLSDINFISKIKKNLRHDIDVLIKENIKNKLKDLYTIN